MKYKTSIFNKYKALFIYQILFWSIAYSTLTFLKFFDFGEIMSLNESNNVKDWGFDVAMIISLSAGFLQGVLLACMDLIIDGKIKEKKSFLTFVIIKALAYFLVIISVITISVVVRNIVLFPSVSGVLSQTLLVLTSRIVAIYIIYAFIMSIVASFLNQIYLNIGPSVFWPLLLGRYYSPVVEERVFMFLDLESSTSHAEKLGHVLFSNLLQDCFFDLNQSLIKFHAQVDQYIGDEAILTWQISKENTNLSPLHCYFDFIKHLHHKHQYYQMRYGFVPRFRAGVNSGYVTVAEIGVSKRSIAYHGDVLNTAARIQKECNRLGISLLVSGAYLKLIPNQKEYRVNHLDTLQLEGKEIQTDVYSVQRQNEENDENSIPTC